LFLVASSPTFVPAQDDAAPAAEAGGGGLDALDLKIKEHVKVSLGAGARTSLRAGDAAADGDNWSENINLDNLRLYLKAEAFEWFGLELNTDIGNAQGFEDAGSGFEEAGNLRVLDAVGKIKATDNVNLWFGRFLPPSDRANLSGPYYTSTCDFPYVQFGYPNIFQGRDDGVALWGERSKEQMEGIAHLKWAVGAFEGATGRANDPNDDDNLMFTGRLVLNLWDAEEGYYNSSTYYGEKDVLALGAAFMHQEDASGIQGDERDFTGFSIDLLMEKKLDEAFGPLGTGGVVTVDAAFYSFDDNDAVDVDPGGVFAPTNRQGESYFITLAYLIPTTIDCGVLSGQLQPYYRYLSYDRDNGGGVDEGQDFGLNYVMKGHSARLTLAYQRRDGGANDGGTYLLGAQLNF
jgi:hypothetical protein